MNKEVKKCEEQKISKKERVKSVTCGGIVNENMPKNINGCIFRCLLVTDI
jgi:hypothetical protein